MAIELPHQGASMDDVRQKFGAPVTDLGAVGKPAITRWVYDQFTVYFEGRRVIQTVQTQPLSASTSVPQAAAPQPVQPARAPAAATPPPAFAPAAAPAAAVVTEPVVETPVVAPATAAASPAASPVVPAALQPATAPEPAPVAPAAMAPAQAASSGGFRFDPATGRLVIDSDAPKEEEPAAAEPAAEPAAPAEPAAEEPVPAAPAESAALTEPAPAPVEESIAPVGEPRSEAPPASAMDETLEFDPETGTFKPKSN